MGYTQIDIEFLGGFFNNYFEVNVRFRVWFDQTDKPYNPVLRLVIYSLNVLYIRKRKKKLVIFLYFRNMILLLLYCIYIYIIY